jgi:hypothetical protein
MSRSVINDRIAEASVGLSPAEAEGLRRFLHGRRIGNGGRHVPRDVVAARLRRWLGERRAEEAAAVAWLNNEERQAT